MGKRTKIGYCLYCGNSRMIEEPEEGDYELDQNEIDRLATWECTCDASRRAREREEQRRTCVENIKALIYDEHPDIAEILVECIGLCQDLTITKVVFTTPSGEKISMKTGKDGVTVRKERTDALEVTA